MLKISPNFTKPNANKNNTSFKQTTPLYCGSFTPPRVLQILRQIQGYYPESTFDMINSHTGHVIRKNVDPFKEDKCNCDCFYSDLASETRFAEDISVQVTTNKNSTPAIRSYGIDEIYHITENKGFTENQKDRKLRKILG